VRTRHRSAPVLLIASGLVIASVALVGGIVASTTALSAEQVPSLVGLNHAQGEALLTSNRLVWNETVLPNKQMPGVIVSQRPSPGTAVARGSVVYIAVDSSGSERRQLTNLIHVSTRLPVSACDSANGPGVRVVAAFEITSAQLKRPPLSDSGPLSRQPPGARWRLCYVVGPNAWVSYGPVTSHATHAVWIYYRNGALAEVNSNLATSYRFKVSP
jgi:PASTA domain